MKLNEKLILLRKSKNLSQIQLAERLGVTRQAISKWESGANLPGVENIIEISYFFNVTIDVLLKENLSVISEEEANKEIDFRPWYKKPIPLIHVLLMCCVCFILGMLVIMK